MDDYNFDNDEGQFGETRRLDDINKEVIKLEAAKKSKAPGEELGDKNAFLDNIESEKFEDADTKEVPVVHMAEYLEDEDDYEDDMTRVIRRAHNRRFMKVGLIIAAIVGVLVFVIGFIFMTAFLRHGTVQAAKNVETESTVLIEDILENGELRVLDLADHLNYAVKTAHATRYTDRSEQQISLQDISRGDIVTIRMKQSNKTAVQIWYPEDVWVRDEVTNFQLDTAAKTIVLDLEGISGEGSLTYTDDTLFLYKENEILPKDLASCDTLTLQGKGNKIYSAVVTASHGYFSITNSAGVQNCFGQVDEGEIVPLTEGEKYPVTEGPHTLTITGENIEPRIESLFIVPTEETAVDLSTVQSKNGVLIIQTDVADYKLYVNGVEVDPAEPVILPQGKEQDVVILKSGYKTWNQKVILTQPSETIYATLEQEVEKAMVSITSTPSGAKVLINGADFGTTPIQKELEYGSYTMQLQLNGYESYLGTITANKPSVSANIELAPHKEEQNFQRGSTDDGTNEGNIS